jgi:GNAT superfamily N-acetyltransferase
MNARLSAFIRKPRPVRGFCFFGLHIPRDWTMALSPEPNFPPPAEITTDLSRIDLDRVHQWLSRKSYWAGEMPRTVFDRAVGGSLCFAALMNDVTVGFARVISDRATFAYLSDVFVDPAQRGRGISKAMMAAVVAHPDVQNLRLWLLATTDAHGLYARYGFTTLVSAQRYMERRDAEVYARMALKSKQP